MRLSVVVILALSLLIAPAQTGKKPDKNALKQDLNQIRRQKDKARRELRKTRLAAMNVRVDIREVDGRLTKVEEDLDRTTNKLSTSRAEQQRLATEIVKTNERFVVVKAKVSKRIRWMYTQGDATFLSAFIGAADVGDLASQQYVLQRIAKQDRAVFNEYKQLQKDLSQKKGRADSLVVEVGNLVEDQRDQQATLEDTKEEKKYALKKLQSKESDLKEALRQFEQDEQEIEAQIARFTSGGGGKGPAYKGKFMHPVKGRITSSFGNRFHPILHRNRLHAGVDFGAKTGTPIVAAAAGEVINAESMRGYGNVVILSHGAGLTTVYAHCSRIFVRRGQKVSQGQRIAAVGSTGLATGPHLHFEVRVNGKATNPMSRL